MNVKFIELVDRKLDNLRSVSENLKRNYSVQEEMEKKNQSLVIQTNRGFINVSEFIKDDYAMKTINLIITRQREWDIERLEEILSKELGISTDSEEIKED